MLILFHFVINKAETEVSAEIRNLFNVTKNFLEAGFKEPAVGILLNLNEVRHFHDLLNFTKALANIGAELHIGNIDHSLITPRFYLPCAAYAVHRTEVEKIY